MVTPSARVRRLRTGELEDPAALRAFLDEAFLSEGTFSDEDWQHATEGWHFVLEDRGSCVSHASVVERTLRIDGRPLRAGYVEAVATRADRRGAGHGAAVLRAVGAFIAARYALGALCTGNHAFYERFGWERWRGRTFVRLAGGVRRTPAEDECIMVLRTPTSPAFDPTGDICCDQRVGDVW